MSCCPKDISSKVSLLFVKADLPDNVFEIPLAIE